MTRPVRLQLSRGAGFRLAEASQAANGLPAKVVARPTRWGNPWRVKIRGKFIDDNAPIWTAAHDQECNYPFHRTKAEAAQRAVNCYRDAIEQRTLIRFTAEDVTDLSGHNLACWCDLSLPCHADVLLALANPQRDQ